MSYNLVISNNKNFFSKNLKNVILDQKIYDQLDDNLLKNHNFELLEDNLNENNERIKNFNFCENLFNEIISEIKDELNSIHNIQWKEKEWKIYLGFWLKKFIYINFYHYSKIQKALNSYKIDVIQITKNKNSYFQTHESNSIQELSINDKWIEILRSEMIKKISKNKNIKIESEYSDEKIHYKEKIFYNTIKKNYNFLKNICFFVSKLINIFDKSKKNLIINTYLDILDEKKLELFFFQIPTYYKVLKVNYKNCDQNLRKKINLTSIRDTELKKIIKILLPNYLPTCFLENFKQIYNLSDKAGYPKNPDSIFTSNSFESDEIFKMYVSKKKNKSNKLKYFVGQHGGSYITRIDNNFSNEVRTCDFFFCWGEKKYKDVPTIPLFNLKNKSLSIKNRSPCYLTLILRSTGYQTLPYDRYNEGKKEIVLVKKFLNLLPKKFKNNLLLRPHYSYFDKKNYFLTKILNDELNDYSKKNISYKETLKNSKLVCFCYDSTGFLENLTSNIPSICLFPDYLKHLNEDCKTYYKKLRDNKLIFDNEKDLINHLNKIWNNIDEWWFGENIQNTINEYSILFSKKPAKDYLSEIKNKIKQKLL